MSDNQKPNTPPDPQQRQPPDGERAYVGPTAIPVTHDPTMETKSVVIAPHLDPRRAPTQRRLDRPPVQAPPEFVESPASDGKFSAAPPLSGPGQLHTTGPIEGPASARTVGGHTERLQTLGSSPPPPPADAAKIRADMSEGDGIPRTVGGRTERLQTVPADVVAAGIVVDTGPISGFGKSDAAGRTVGGRTQKLQTVPTDLAFTEGGDASHAAPVDPPTDSSRWATDPAASVVDRSALPSNYGATLGAEPKSDRSPDPTAVASTKPARNNNTLIIGVLAVLVVGAVAFLALRGSSEGDAATSAPPISVPTPKQTSASVVAAPSPDLPSPTAVATDPATSSAPAGVPVALTGHVLAPRPSVVGVTPPPTLNTAKPVTPAPTGPVLPPRPF